MAGTVVEGGALLVYHLHHDDASCGGVRGMRGIPVRTAADISSSLKIGRLFLANHLSYVK